MVNMTESEQHQPTATLYCSNVHGTYNIVFLAAFNIILSVVASLGNCVILIALHKESYLHPPSKLLYRCLAITDLIVGLVSQPLFATQLLLDLNGRPQLCTGFGKWVDEISLVFSLVSGVIVTAISVDRLLALLLGLRYRQVVTLIRVSVVLSFIWLIGVICAFIDAFWPILGSIITGYVITLVTITCLIISAYCYTRIFLRLRHNQAQIQGQVEQPAGPGIPLNIARYRRTVSAGGLGPDNIIRLLSSTIFGGCFRSSFLSQCSICNTWCKMYDISCVLKFKSQPVPLLLENERS